MKKLLFILCIFVGLQAITFMQAQSFENAMKVTERPVVKSDKTKSKKTPFVSQPPKVQKRPENKVVPQQQPEPKTYSIQSPHPDFVIKLLGCKQTGDVALITFTIMNTAKDVKITLYPYHAEAFDDAGNSYPVQCILKDQPVNYPVTQLLPTDIPVKFILKVNNIETSATQLPRLQIKCEAENKVLVKDLVMFKSLIMQKE